MDRRVGTNLSRVGESPSHDLEPASASSSNIQQMFPLPTFKDWKAFDLTFTQKLLAFFSQELSLPLIQALVNYHPDMPVDNAPRRTIAYFCGLSYERVGRLGHNFVVSRYDQDTLEAEYASDIDITKLCPNCHRVQSPSCFEETASSFSSPIEQKDSSSMANGTLDQCLHHPILVDSDGESAETDLEDNYRDGGDVETDDDDVSFEEQGNDKKRARSMDSDGEEDDDDNDVVALPSLKKSKLVEHSACSDDTHQLLHAFKCRPCPLMTVGVSSITYDVIKNARCSIFCKAHQTVSTIRFLRSESENQFSKVSTAIRNWIPKIANYLAWKKAHVGKSTLVKQHFQPMTQPITTSPLINPVDSRKSIAHASRHKVDNTKVSLSSQPSGYGHVDNQMDLVSVVDQAHEILEKLVVMTSDDDFEKDITNPKKTISRLIGTVVSFGEHEKKILLSLESAQLRIPEPPPTSAPVDNSNISASFMTLDEFSHWLSRHDLSNMDINKWYGIIKQTNFDLEMASVDVEVAQAMVEALPLTQGAAIKVLLRRAKLLT